MQEYDSELRSEIRRGSELDERTASLSLSYHVPPPQE